MISESKKMLHKRLIGHCKSSNNATDQTIAQMTYETFARKMSTKRFDHFIHYKLKKPCGAPDPKLAFGIHYPLH